MDKVLMNQMLRGAWAILAITIIVIALYYTIPIVYPFIIGLVIAYMLNPLVNLLQLKAKFPRWLAVTISVLLFLSIAATAVTILIANIVVEIGYLTELIQANMERWKSNITEYFNSDYFQNVINQINTFYTQNPDYHDTIKDSLAKSTASLANASTFLVTLLLEGIVILFKLLPTISAVMIIALLAAFFISKDWNKLSARISGLFSDYIRKTTHTVWGDLQKALFGFIRAQLVLVSLTAVLVIIGLLILRVEYAISIGLLIGFVDLLPYLGTGAVLVPWIIYVFIQGNVPLGIGLSILYGVILIARQLVEPKVLAKSIGLEPLAILFALVVGLNLFGVIGLLVGPVVLILLSSFYRANVFHDMCHYIIHGRGASQRR